MIDEKGNRYYLAIGRAIDQNNKVIQDFTWNYFGAGANRNRLERPAGMVPGGQSPGARQLRGRNRPANHAFQPATCRFRRAALATNWTG